MVHSILLRNSNNPSRRSNWTRHNRKSEERTCSIKSQYSLHPPRDHCSGDGRYTNPTVGPGYRPSSYDRIRTQHSEPRSRLANRQVQSSKHGQHRNRGTGKSNRIRLLLSAESNNDSLHAPPGIRKSSPIIKAVPLSDFVKTYLLFQCNLERIHVRQPIAYIRTTCNER